MYASRSAAPSQPVATTRIRIANLVMSALLIGSIIFLLFYRLDYYPNPWYDEGAYMKVAKNYAYNGVYADYSSEGNRFFGPVISTGPTVILPVSMMFSVFGPSVFAARTVPALYAALMLLILFFLARQLTGSRTAGILAVVLVFTAPGVDFQYYARIIIGEIAGISFLLGALWFWLKPGKIPVQQLLIVGLLFGLACVTKTQFATFILPALLLAWIVDLVWYKQRPWFYYVIPGITAGIITFGWLFFAIAVLGGSDVIAENWTAFRFASTNAFSLSFASMRRAMDFLTSHGVYGGLLLSGLLYTGLLALRRTTEGQLWGVFLLFLAGSGMMYLIAVPEWTRYALPALVLGTIPLLQLVVRLAANLPFQKLSLRGMLAGQEIQGVALLGILVSALVLSMIIAPLARMANNTLRHGEYEAAYNVAAYIRANIPPDALIETWEKELSIITDHTFHYPPQLIELTMGDDMFREDTDHSKKTYDFRNYVTPDYVIAGPFSKWVNIYKPETLREQGYKLIYTYYLYDIYQRG
ncbi:MAG TPA: glycosyltransferase family 39 protein [Phototrophicaceae bacterium]|nr:glycosyltransferase family 39 protein [Phototrophicaceae bacterium]